MLPGVRHHPVGERPADPLALELVDHDGVVEDVRRPAGPVVGVPGDAERGIVEAMSAKLVADGMFFVGIDVIGDKVVEINADSPGGMQAVERLYDIDVCPKVIDAVERRATA